MSKRKSTIKAVYKNTIKKNKKIIKRNVKAAQESVTIIMNQRNIIDDLTKKINTSLHVYRVDVELFVVHVGTTRMPMNMPIIFSRLFRSIPTVDELIEAIGNDLSEYIQYGDDTFKKEDLGSTLRFYADVITIPNEKFVAEVNNMVHTECRMQIPLTVEGHIVKTQVRVVGLNIIQMRINNIE